MSLNKNIFPYFDDFDAAKNYFQIIFNPSRAVQARELSQIGSTAQNQLSSFADHIFKNGSAIHEAQVLTNSNKTIITLDSVTTFVAGDFLNKTIVAGNIGAVTATAVVTGEDVANQKLYVEIRGGAFSDSEQIRITDTELYGYDINPLNDPYSSAPEYYQVTINAVDGVINDGLVASVSTGIIYIGGYFVVVPEAEIIVDDVGSAGSYKIGFNFEENFVTSDTDSTLFDPASGSFNFNAPGADRVQGIVTLISYKEADYATIPADFITIVELVNGDVVYDQSETQYGAILELLAERTYDQAGHYAVDAFGLDVTTNTGDDTQLDYKIEPGKAVVNGFEVETLAAITKIVSKAREFKTVSASVTSEYGHYFEVGLKSGATDNTEFDVQGLFDVSSKEKIYFWTGTDGTGQKLGEGRVIALRRESKKMRIYIFDGSDAGAAKISSIFTAVQSVSTSATTGGSVYANVYREDNKSVLYGHENTNLIFELPTKATKSIANNSVSYEVNSIFKNSPVSGDTVTLSAPDLYTDFETTFPYGVIATVRTDTGAIIPSDITGATVVTNSPGVASTIVLDFGTTPPSANVDVSIRMVRTAQDGNAKTKALVPVTESAVFTYDNAAGNNVVLANHDIVRIVSIKTNPGGVAIDLAASSVALNNGTDNYIYFLGSVAIASGDIELADSISYDIEYEYFSHSGTGDYFSVNSYPDYDGIPSYTTPAGDKTVDLRNVLDFRRTIADIASENITTVHPNVTISITEYDYYLPRYDSITVDENGVFEVIEGNAEDRPKKPNLSSKTMELYSLLVPAYTFNDDDLEIKRIENKNYTMNEIGKLEKRLEALEYYNSLSVLERDAKDLSILDVNGLEKFKNGVLVDTFTGHGVGDIQHSDYDINIDAENQIARTPVNIDHKDFVEDGTSSNITEHPNITTLAYTTAPLIKQLLVSETMFVNPYNISLWNGSIEINPPSDNWVDTDKLPVTINNFNGSAAAWTSIGNQVARSAGFGVQWGSWRSIWQGASVTGRFETSTTTANPVWGWGEWNKRSDSETDRTFDIRQRLSIGRRSGTRVEHIPETTRKTIGNRVINTSVVPWMRTRTIAFDASGLKPSTVYVASFDDIDVTSNITWGGAYAGGKSDETGRVEGTFSIPVGTFKTGARTFRLEDDVVNPTSSAEATYTARGLLKTSKNSIVSLETPNIRRTSIRRALTSRNRTTVQTSSLTAPRTKWTDPLAQSFLINDEGGVFVSAISLFFKYKDLNIPITVSIVTNENGYPSKNEVPFAKKTLYPTNATDIKAQVKGASGVLALHANSVDNTDASLASVFTFDNPIKLEQGVEYSFIITSNSDQYETFVGQIGVNDLEGNLIAKQPYTGVMFKSQNSLTWTADQTRDIKFQIDRCVFETTGTYNLEADTAADQDVTAINLNIDSLSFNKTGLNWEYKFTEDVVYVPTVLKEDIEFSALRTIPVATPLKLKSTFTSTADNLSPVINNNRMSAIVIENDVDTASPDANLRYPAGTYITKTVKMANISDEVKVLIDAIKPSASEIEVYFKLGETTPRYLEISDLDSGSKYYDELLASDPDGDIEKAMRDIDKGLVASVYHYESSAPGSIAEKIGTSIITDITSERSGGTIVPDSRKLYMKEISDVTHYVDAADASITFENVIISTDSTIADNAATNFTWAAGTYNLGEYVTYSDKIYKVVATSTTTTPSQYAGDWEEVPSYFIQTTIAGTDGDHVIREDASLEWLPMVVEAGAVGVEDPEAQVIEYSYIPEKEIDEAFTSISLKIVLKAKNKVDIPTFGSFRAIATY